MKFLYALVLGMVLGGMPVFAQNQSPSAEDMLARMKSQLQLTQDQMTAVMPIIEKYASKREEWHQLIEDGTADRNNVHSQMKQLRADENQELSQVLSADQMKAWERMHSAFKHKKEGDGGGFPST